MEQETHMNILVFGAGGIGGFITGRLGALLESSESRLNSLSLIARGAHLEAIREKGLIYISPEGESTTVHPTVAAESLDAVPPPDVIFLCVKGYDLNAAVETIRPFVKSDTVVLPLLNGADIYDRVREELPVGTVLPGAIYISSSITEAGTVRHTGGQGLIVTGEEPERGTEKPEELLELFDEAGIPYEWHRDPFPSIWTKFIFISPFGLVTAVSGKTLGEVLADPALSCDVEGMMREVAALARARKVELPEDIVEKTLQNTAAFPPDTKTSLQRDVEAKKPKDERDLFGGAVLRMAEKAGVATPLVEKYLNALHS
jgi:2-dehydropantoate 2-reductase